MKETKYILRDCNTDIVLDEEQCKVIEDVNHNMIVIAGAGSGKTTTMVAKVKYLVEQNKIEPSDILFLSFTKDTVGEIRNQLWNQYNIKIDIMTFHSLALTIVKKAYPQIQVLCDPKPVLRKLIKEECNNNLNFKYSFNQIVPSPLFRNNEDFISQFIVFLERKRTKGIHTHELVKQSNIKRKMLIFLDVCQLLERKYESYQLNHYFIDFYSMIIEATELIKMETVKLKYRYIIIDEYQDISLERFLFIQALYRQCQAYFIAVGDDWQAIYGFSGSRVVLFHLFHKLIPDVQEYYLLNTYRNSQELIDIAGRFIMKDKMLYQKNLLSKKHIQNPIQYCYYYHWNRKKKLLQAIHKLAEISHTILILGRYKKDIAILKEIPLLTINPDNRIIYCHYPKVRIQYLTVHAAKGLGYDNVIVMNMKNNKYGFPSKVQDNEIMHLLASGDDSQAYEERRLFYVALTRSKNYVYLMIPMFQQSRYVKEIKKDFH